MKENWSKLILKNVGEGIGVTSDIVISILEAGYGASRRQLERKFWEAQHRRHRFFEKDYSPARRKISNLISKLKREGLIQRKGDLLSLTKAGFIRLTKSRINLPEKDYDKKETKTFKIIAFDVPERLRSKRAWLRESLSRLGFTMLQRSVWYGKYSLPEKFIEHIDELELGDFVQILEITKGGSLIENK